MKNAPYVRTAAKPHCFIYQWSLQNLTSGILKIFKVGRHMCRYTHKETTYVERLIGSIFNIYWKRIPKSHKYLIFSFLLSSSLWKIANRIFQEIELHTHHHWPSCCSELQLSGYRHQTVFIRPTIPMHLTFTHLTLNWGCFANCVHDKCSLSPISIAEASKWTDVKEAFAISPDISFADPMPKGRTWKLFQWKFSTEKCIVHQLR